MGGSKSSNPDNTRANLTLITASYGSPVVGERPWQHHSTHCRPCYVGVRKECLESKHALWHQEMAVIKGVKDMTWTN